VPMRRAAELSVPAPTIAAIYGMVHMADLRNRGTVRALGPGDVQQG
jgi:hypothetical protein